MMKRRVVPCWLIVAAALWANAPLAAQRVSDRVVLNDAHFHLTDYIQRGPDIHDFLKLMGDSIGRVALFGIPFQQEWLYQSTGDDAPSFYLLHPTVFAFLSHLHRSGEIGHEIRDRQSLWTRS